ncbi:hypothetical protein [Nostoc sp. DedSLP04]|uniref:hypothetical protein n=1 Tax=Nostoc sp. DedSLP04 TaxID=3075401 RepID=UPI002AD29766|nr:hypothetical protein [Nostoc sp. DedSLP04]MDZ8031727.1 hypothetical protein [Nostoc sp. DedSLP04]
MKSAVFQVLRFSGISSFIGKTFAIQEQILRKRSPESILPKLIWFWKRDSDRKIPNAQFPMPNSP